MAKTKKRLKDYSPAGAAARDILDGEGSIELVAMMESENLIDEAGYEKLPDGCLADFHLTLKKIRKGLGMTQAQLAKRIGVTRRYYARWEGGGMVIGTRAKRIDEVLEEEIEELLDEHPALRHIHVISLPKILRDDFRRMEVEGEFVNNELRKIPAWPDMPLKKLREALGYIYTRALNWRYWQYKVYMKALAERMLQGTIRIVIAERNE